MFDAMPDTPDRDVPAAAGTQARLRLLRRMSEIGMRMAERLDRSSELAAVHAEAAGVPERLQAGSARRLDEIARAFARVSRAVSLSVSLEDRLERGPPPSPQLSPQPTPQAAPVEARSRLGARRAEAARALDEAIDDEVGGRDPVRAAGLRLDLDRLLDRELAAVDAFLERPLDEVIARIRRDLGLGADDPSPGRGRI